DGDVAVGVPAHWLAADALLRGLGAPKEKLEELLSVSVQPPPARKIAVVLLRPGAGVPSEQLAVPYPTKSTMLLFIGQVPVSRVLLLTIATFPAVALIPIEATASGVGRFTVPPAPCSS